MGEVYGKEPQELTNNLRANSNYAEADSALVWKRKNKQMSNNGPNYETRTAKVDPTLIFVLEHSVKGWWENWNAKNSKGAFSV